MGAVSVVGGLTALRLPETLHCSLPQTAEEGEEFGKDWTYADCCKCGGQRYKSNARKSKRFKKKHKYTNIYSIHLQYKLNLPTVMCCCQNVGK